MRLAGAIAGAVVAAILIDSLVYWLEWGLPLRVGLFHAVFWLFDEDARNASQSPALYAFARAFSNLPLILLSFVLLLLTFLGRGVDNRETRCRMCKNVLRGLSEPRCPECGEAI